MLTTDCIRELKTHWLPNITDTGLDRLIEMLEQGSPLLVHGCFTKAVPMGCLATHIAWNHPRTADLNVEAGITWLHRVARLNPATSLVIREWDCKGAQNWEVRSDMLAVLKEERQARRQPVASVSRLPQLVEV